MYNRVACCALLLAVLSLGQSCEYHELESLQELDSDQSLFEEVNQTGFSYYAGGSLLSPANESPHGKFRLRFNAIAESSLDASGRLPKGASFLPGAVIVKEVYDGNNVAVYAVLKKAPTDVRNGRGWLWAEIKPGGIVSFGIDHWGNGCISCHSNTPNRDLVRTFDFH